MPVIKCKMCGGDLNIVDDSTVCECEYCGTKQTVPKVDDEKKLKLFERANRLRTACEFDKAAGVYESIVADFDEEAEAYWGLILCKFGIEYVDDPATGNKIPTCHRSSFDSLMDDPNFDMVMECADPIARKVYLEEAKQIEELRKRIIEVSSQEEPYDVFISYKELDDEGQRTLDSVIAQDIYTELTEKGYRVFFSRISLEDKLGVEYEPYIFAALNSAKVMLVVGTDYDYFNAVWVKNEWSRFLMLIASGQKKTLIPVFKGIDAYDLPKEFRRLAAQDMGKIGAMQDLVRGVEKLISKGTTFPKEKVKETVVVQQSGGPNIASLLKRGQQALEDGDWDRAVNFFDQVLDWEAENSDAFFGLFLANVKCTNEDEYIQRVCARKVQPEILNIAAETDRINLAIKQYTVDGFLMEDEIRPLFSFDLTYPSTLTEWEKITAEEKMVFENDRNLARAILYSENDRNTRAIRFRNKLYTELDAVVKRAQELETAEREKITQKYEEHILNAEKTANEMYLQAIEARETSYQNAVQQFQLANNIEDYQNAKTSLLMLNSYKESYDIAQRCNERITQLKNTAEAEINLQRIQAENAEKKRRLAKKRIFLVAIAIILTYVVFRTLITIYKYKQAEKAYSDLASLVTSTSTENMSSDSEQSDEIGINQENSPLHVDFDTLRAKSTDYVAWIFSPDTIINYPIAYTDNNFYYLDHTPEGKTNAGGTIFIDCRNASDFSDQNTCIYGVNMHDGSMFASLCNYQDSSYYDKHPVIYLSTPEFNYRLDLIAGFVTGQTSFAYASNFDSPEQFEEHIALSRDLSTFRSNVKVQSGDKIVTLSTSTNKGNDNFVVLGKLTRID